MENTAGEIMFGDGVKWSRSGETPARLPAVAAAAHVVAGPPDVDDVAAPLGMAPGGVPPASRVITSINVWLKYVWAKTAKVTNNETSKTCKNCAEGGEKY